MTDRRECKHKHYKSQDRQMTDRRECKHNNTNSRQHWHNNFMNSLRHTYKLDTTHQLIIHTHLSTCLQALNTSKTVHSSFFRGILLMCSSLTFNGVLAVFSCFVSQQSRPPVLHSAYTTAQLLITFSTVYQRWTRLHDFS